MRLFAYINKYGKIHPFSVTVTAAAATTYDTVDLEVLVRYFMKTNVGKVDINACCSPLMTLNNYTHLH